VRNLKGMTFGGLTFECSESALYVLCAASYVPNPRFSSSTSVCLVIERQPNDLSPCEPCRRAISQLDACFVRWYGSNATTLCVGRILPATRSHRAQSASQVRPVVLNLKLPN